MEDTLRDFWATRPTRPRRGRKIAGVAAGIGNRYGIDPIVVRVAFVIITFYGGAGILVYLLGWLLLREQDDEAAPFESMISHRRSSTSTAFTVLLCLGLIPAFLFFLDSEVTGIFGLLIAAGALFLVHRGRGHLGRPAPTPPATPGTATSGFPTEMPPTMPMSGSMPGSPSVFTSGPTPGSAAGSTSVPTASAGTPVTEPVAGEPPRASEPPQPPAWDPLGAAPFAWDLPEPSPPAPEPPAPRKRSKAGLMTVGAALITAGALALAAPYVGWLTPGHIVGILLAVLGLGMIGGSFVRGGRGLIGLAVPLSVIGMALTVISPTGFHGVGEINERPTALAGVQDSYRRSAGDIELDLTALPASGSVDTDVRVDAGQVVVIVPRTADVRVTCAARAGDLDCLGRRADGTGSELTVHDNGEDGPGGLQISLDAEVGVGHVEVRRD